MMFRRQQLTRKPEVEIDTCPAVTQDSSEQWMTTDLAEHDLDTIAE